MKIKNIGSNQTEVWVKDGVVLVSYATPVAAVYKGQSYRTDVNYSRTTSKHISQWLRQFDGTPKYESPVWLQCIMNGDDM